MGVRKGKIWPVLALGFVLTLPCAARAEPAATMGASRPTASLAVKCPDATLRRGVSSIPGAPHQFVASATGIERACRPVSSGGLAKTYALVLSMFGMLGVIALHHLDRTF